MKQMNIILFVFILSLVSVNTVVKHQKAKGKLADNVPSSNKKRTSFSKDNPSK